MSEEQETTANRDDAGADGMAAPREPLPGSRLRQIVEGLLMAAGKPLSLKAIAGVFSDEERPSDDELRQALAEIEQDCAERGFELREVASGYRFQVRESLSPWVSRLWDEKPQRYSRATLETLALIAYRQPITRGEIEEIRGVSVNSNIIRSLLEREWVRVVGHRDVPGRPAMLATTRGFLDYFNLASLQDLPPLSEVRELEQVNREFEFQDQQGGSRVLEVPEESSGSAEETQDGSGGPDPESEGSGDERTPHYADEELPDEAEARELARRPLDEILGDGDEAGDGDSPSADDGRAGE